MSQTKVKAVLVLECMPETCLDCPINDYSTTDDSEELYCQFLVKEVDGFLSRDKDCPLKEVELPDEKTNSKVLHGIALCSLLIGFILGLCLGLIIS